LIFKLDYRSAGTHPGIFFGGWGGSESLDKVFWWRETSIVNHHVILMSVVTTFL